MGFFSEIQPGTRLLLGLTETGQGKATGAATLRPYFPKVPMVHPSNGNLLTRLIWEAADRQYVMNGQAGSHQERYDARRAKGVSAWKVGAANAELVLALRARGAHLLSMHGAFGYGAERTVVEIDTKVEPLIAEPNTLALVPLPRTRDELREMGHDEKKIQVVGFLVPDELKDAERKQQRLDTFARKEPMSEDPLRVAFMTTGQFGHQDILRDQILGDETVREWLFDGRLILDIYMWNSARRAREVYDQAYALGLEPVLTNQFKRGYEKNVQIVSNQDTFQAIQNSINMAAAADIVVSPIAERVGWTLELPFISLLPVGNNRKMRSNMEWTESNGLTVPMNAKDSFGEVLVNFFAGGASYGRRHDEAANETKAKYPYNLTNAAQQTKDIVTSRLRSR